MSNYTYKVIRGVKCRLLKTGSLRRKGDFIRDNLLVRDNKAFAKFNAINHPSSGFFEVWRPLRNIGSKKPKMDCRLAWGFRYKGKLLPFTTANRYSKDMLSEGETTERVRIIPIL